MRSDLGVSRWARPAAVATGLLFLFAVQIYTLAIHAAFYAAALAYPLELDYGEGIVWQQMRDMFDGSAYGPLQTYPAIVYHYPPVFHLLTGCIAAVAGSDELATGRLVSLAASVSTAVLVGALVMEVGRTAATRAVGAGAGTIAALLFLDINTIAKWSPVMRVDSLAGALALLGILLAIRALDRPAAIYGAAAAFVLSIYTKQTMIAAPMAVFGVLVFARPALAGRGIAASVAGGLVLLAIALWATDGGFLRHIVLYNVNSIDIWRLQELGLSLLEYIPLLVVAGAGVRKGLSLLRGGTGGVEAARIPWAKSGTTITMAILLLYLVIKTAMLLMIVKKGASSNYLVEWFSVISIFAGIGLFNLFAVFCRSADANRVKSSPLLLCMVAGGIPAQLLLGMPDYPTGAQLMAQAHRLDAVVARIAASPKPVISDDMTLIIRAGRKVEWEPAIVAELIRTGQYDERPFLRMVEGGRFGFFITRGTAGRELFDERYTPATAAAMSAAFPRLERVSGLTLHLPSSSAASLAKGGGSEPTQRPTR